ncbi:phosphohistidine phosphatase SixA [Yersinia mollaretii]|uniref:Phosphohistidine phosphatase SixA n=1 Tax=Yersinia mollaretii TaxID=33060 RepID=A0AA44CK27_YERMO|nr:phosphohistidine phosphatase SixA [Yersinia mollaretii]CNL38262.1 phosphohistidine phosphatase [Yersinia enterocolitica]NIL22180.1 phosphohistidine phosphatase SixA [Yersinia mollaretii]CNJ12397.1 phosphohistidine phosphatase [Yersinia mollaretii]CNK73922.1 phosphohistidine phosphatase [Yersinia mollaretii]CQR05874.1 phosphohistidine phosphatase [Yersinia mollaretii]
MQVFIMRHGDAALDAASDALRPLTLCGQDESRQIASWLNEQSVDIDQILVSPYLRAEQTLEVVRGVMPLPAEQEVMPELTPGGDAAFISCYLQALAKEDHEAVLVISHLPLVGYLVAELCPGQCPPMFATSAIACISLNGETGKGTFDWQVSPTQLLAKACHG